MTKGEGWFRDPRIDHATFDTRSIDPIGVLRGDF